MPCSSSRATVLKVDNCPRNVFEWRTRAASKKCSSLKQPCVEVNKFVYHCVLNENGTGLVEVCAPAKYIHGNVFYLL